MLKSKILALTAIAALGVSTHAYHANAATLIEAFNDYGTQSSNLGGKGSTGGGWSGGWSQTSVLRYEAGVQLTFNNDNYSNAFNQTGPNDGAAGYGEGNAGSTLKRNFSAPLTGTIWISALTRYTSSTADTLIWFGDNNSFVAIRNGNAVLRHNGTNEEGPATTFGPNETYLLLAKIIIDANGDSDDVSFWVKTESADLSSETALGAPTRRVTSANAVGTELSSIRLSFEEAGTLLDQLRISNDPNAFAQVTAIPEPAGLGAMALGLCLLARRRLR